MKLSSHTCGFCGEEFEDPVVGLYNKLKGEWFCFCCVDCSSKWQAGVGTTYKSTPIEDAEKEWELQGDAGSAANYISCLEDKIEELKVEVEELRRMAW